MLTGSLAITVMSVFSGAALYINVSESPARLKLDPAAALRQWKPAYARGYAMQFPLALLGTGLGFAAFAQSGNITWLIGAVFALANWPFTATAIMPLNRRLRELDPGSGEARTLDLLRLWARLHAWRTCFGLLSVLCFLAAAG